MMDDLTKFPRPSVTVDCVIFGYENKDLQLLLVERGIEPFKGSWALPGGFVRSDETVDDAARRELKEETGVTNVYLEQLYTFGGLKRDPRGWVITVAYYALIKLSSQRVRAATDVSQAQWFSVDALPSLAFDHREIVDKAIDRLRGKLRYEPIGFELLPKKFTLTQLQRLYETILQSELDKRNFRKKLLGMNLLIELDEFQTDVPHRAPRLYQFDEKKYKALRKKGFNFDL